MATPKRRFRQPVDCNHDHLMDLFPLMSQIVTLKTRMSVAEAMERFRSGGVRRWFHSRQRGRLMGVRNVYIPYRVFQVRVSNRGQEQVSWLALDAITGRLDLHRFESAPDHIDAVVVESEAALPTRLSVDEMRKLLIERVRRQVYLSGFFRLRNLRIEAESTDQEVHIPYWVGIYRKEDRMSIDVIDAVRKQFEGAKVRDMILHWL